MHHSTTSPTMRAGTYFYLSTFYFDIPEIDRLSDSAQLVHLELLAQYTDRRAKRPLTGEDLKRFPRKAIREIRDQDLIHEDEDGAYHLVEYAGEFQIFKWGPHPTQRPPFPRGMRERIYARDGYACLHCGATEPLSLDHIIPWSKGGEHTEDNLQTLCRPCNSRKGAKLNYVV